MAWPVKKLHQFFWVYILFPDLLKKPQHWLWAHMLMPCTGWKGYSCGKRYFNQVFRYESGKLELWSWTLWVCSHLTVLSRGFGSISHQEVCDLLLGLMDTELLLLLPGSRVHHWHSQCEANRVSVLRIGLETG